MKSFYLFLLCFICNSVFSQDTSRLWSWDSGSDLLNQVPVYGVKGVPDATGFPGSRHGAATWSTPDGKLWLFGGNIRRPDGSGGYINDLWVYDPVTKLWTWKNGPKASDPPAFSYGTIGVPDAGNLPRSRGRANAWTDKSGNLWLFGGEMSASDNYLNDLWKYDPVTGFWTWVSGTPSIWERNIYGQRGVPDPVSMPGSRILGATTVDNDGNFWLVGGLTEIDLSVVIKYTIRDVWKFDPASQLWTWYEADGGIGASISFGSKGVPSASNAPPTRLAAALWADGNGNLYWFGGGEVFLTGQGPSSGDYEFGSALHNDLWRYNIQTNIWTWINGSNQRDPAASYGTKGIPDAANTPGGRSNFATFSPVDGKFQVFGGSGKTENSSGSLNDLWSYNPTANMWTWVEGSKDPFQPGNYGIKGVPAASNIPGARIEPSGFTDSSKNLWIYGGIGFNAGPDPGELADLWKLSAAEDEEDSVEVFESFTAMYKKHYTELKWKIAKDQHTNYIIVEHSKNGNDFKPLGRVNAPRNSSSRNYSYIHVLPGNGNHWYRLQHFSKKGGSAYSWIEKVVVGNSFQLPHHFNISFLLFPNPVKDWLYMSFNSTVSGNMQVMVYNNSGQPIIKQQQKIGSGFNTIKLNLNNYKPGVYTVVVTMNGKMYSKKMIKL